MSHFVSLSRCLHVLGGVPGVAALPLATTQRCALYEPCHSYATQSGILRAAAAKVKRPAVQPAHSQPSRKPRKRSASPGRLDITSSTSLAPSTHASRHAQRTCGEGGRNAATQAVVHADYDATCPSSRKPVSKRRGSHTEPSTSFSCGAPSARECPTNSAATSSSSAQSADTERFREEKLAEADVRHAIRTIMCQHLMTQRERQRVVLDRMAEERERIEQKFSASRERIEAKTINSMRLLGSDTAAVGEGIVPLFARTTRKQSRDSYGWAYGRRSEGDRVKGSSSAWMMPNPVGLSAAASAGACAPPSEGAPPSSNTPPPPTRSSSLHEQYTTFHSTAAQAQRMHPDGESSSGNKDDTAVGQAASSTYVVDGGEADSRAWHSNSLADERCREEAEENEDATRTGRREGGPERRWHPCASPTCPCMRIAMTFAYPATTL